MSYDDEMDAILFESEKSELVRAGAWNSASAARLVKKHRLERVRAEEEAAAAQAAAEAERAAQEPQPPPMAAPPAATPQAEPLSPMEALMAGDGPAVSAAGRALGDRFGLSQGSSQQRLIESGVLGTPTAPPAPDA